MSDDKDALEPTVKDESAAANRQASSLLTRLRRSKIVRLAGGLLVVAALLGILAITLMRLLGPQDRFTAFSLPYVQDFSDLDVKRWFSAAGVWSIRNETLAQTTNLDEPAQIFVPQKLTPEQLYHLSTYISLSDRTRAAGVNFNAQYQDLTGKLHRVAVARKSDDTDRSASAAGAMELIAGYTDPEGAFVPQVTVPFTSTAQDYRLDLYVLGNTYLVQLNGQTLIDRRPLFYPNGLVGFYALGPATFDTLKLSVAEDRPPGERVYVSDFDQAPGGAGWVPFSGDWQVSQGELVQADPSAQDTGIGYEGGAFESYVLQTTLRNLVGVGGGVLFNMPSPYQRNGAHIVRFSDQADALFWGYFDDAGAFTRQGFAEIDPPGADPHQIQVFIGETGYDVFLDGDLLARDVPLQRSSGHIGLTTSQSSIGYALVEVFPLFGGTPVALVQPAAPEAALTPSPAASPPQTPTPAPTPRATRALPAATPLAAGGNAIARGDAASFTGAFTGTLASAGWRPIGGRWRFEDGSLVQADAAGFDQGIVYTGQAFRDYSFATDLTHLQGNGGGVLFNMPYTDRLAGAHMVRYSDRRPGGIFWGYFDETGKFVGQGYATVDPPANGPHNLRVVSGDSTYSIYLDDRLLVDGVPLQQDFGYVGLVTTQTAAAFDSARVAGVQGVTASPTRMPGGATTGVTSGATAVIPPAGERRVVSGNWEIAGGVYQQTEPAPADYVLNTGVYASNYTVAAEVVLPDKPEVGGGFVIHMPERDRKVGAYVVRLIRGGAGIFWGSYDTAGAFRGRGSAELPPNPEGTYRIRVVVVGDTVDIFVDDQLIAEKVSLPRAEGWIGLLAFGGPVTFRNVNISVGLGQ